MKKIFALGLSLVLMLVLTGCIGGGTNEPYTVEKYGMVYTVDEQAGTIDDGEHIYHFVINPYGNGYQAEITYPNGATYYWTSNGSFGHGGWSDDYDDTLYADGSDLMDVIEDGRPGKSDPKPVGLVLLLLAVGIFNALSPQTAWFLEYGWRYKNAEPSEFALAANRIGGVIAILAAVLMLIFG